MGLAAAQHDACYQDGGGCHTLFPSLDHVVHPRYKRVLPAGRCFYQMNNSLERYVAFD